MSQDIRVSSFELELPNEKVAQLLACEQYLESKIPKIHEKILKDLEPGFNLLIQAHQETLRNFQESIRQTVWDVLKTELESMKDETNVWLINPISFYAASIYIHSGIDVGIIVCCGSSLESDGQGTAGLAESSHKEWIEPSFQRNFASLNIFVHFILSNKKHKSPESCATTWHLTYWARAAAHWKLRVLRKLPRVYAFAVETVLTIRADNSIS